MKRFLNNVLSILVWVALLTYLIWAGRMCSHQMHDQGVRDVKVVVRDSAASRIITPGMVRLWLAQSGIDLRNSAVDEVNTAHIRDLVLGHLFVADAKVFSDLGGRITISLTQRKPIARVNTDNGYGFYITSDRYILPLQSHEVVYVPVITGNFTLPFDQKYVGPLKEPGAGEKNLRDYYLFTLKLINFVGIIEASDFWRSEVEQIVVDGQGQADSQEPKVEIVPRSGDHIVSLGTLDDIPAKLDRLLAFYRNGLRYEGWGSYKTVSVEYDGQVVCTK